MMKGCFPGDNQVKKLPTTTVGKVCTYFKNKRKRSNTGFDLTPEIEHILSTS